MVEASPLDGPGTESATREYRQILRCATDEGGAFQFGSLGPEEYELEVEDAKGKRLRIVDERPTLARPARRWISSFG